MLFAVSALCEFTASRIAAPPRLDQCAFLQACFESLMCYAISRSLNELTKARQFYVDQLEAISVALKARAGNIFRPSTLALMSIASRYSVGTRMLTILVKGNVV